LKVRFLRSRSEIRITTEVGVPGLFAALKRERVLGRSVIALLIMCFAFLSCTSSSPGKTAETYSNPVFRHDAPDPSIIRAADGNFYIYTTQSIYSAGVLNLPILKSADLVHWKLAGQVFRDIPRWVVGGPGGDMWAPHGLLYRGKYYVYYAAREYGTGIMAIGVATSDNPTGPFKDLGRPLRKWEKKNYVAIDPFVFQARDGHLYLYWGSNSDPLRAQQLTSDGLHLVGKPKVVLASRPSDNGGLIEGPWILPHGSYYYLMYSQGDCCSSHPNYQVAVARSTSPLGPFTRDPNNPILKGNSKFTATGHNATIADDAQRDWIIYHARVGGQDVTRDRDIMIDPIEWVDGWPSVKSGVPSSGPHPVPVVRR
jgi:arabinan endo-1,5-alpha-L-arabinosidase